MLREELGAAARIVGPSTTRWRLDWIKGLADFCLQRGCRFDAVSWHDLPNDMRSLPRLSDRLARTRDLLSRVRYRALRVREFHVNEIMGQRIQFTPGAAVGYFSELEDGRADVAIKSCWPDSSGRVNCAGTDPRRAARLGHRPAQIALVHLARLCRRSRQPGAMQTRATERIAVLASRRSRHPGEAQLLLGNIGTTRRQASVRLCGLSALTAGRKRASRAALRVERHPDAEEAVHSPSLDNRVRELRVDANGRCATGRLPLPHEGGALVAYLKTR